MTTGSANLEPAIPGNNEFIAERVYPDGLLLDSIELFKKNRLLP